MSRTEQQHAELTDLLRQVIASNLTSAYQTELLRRALHPERDQANSHPMAKVLEVFETMCDLMSDEGDDEADDAPLLDEEGLEIPGATRASSRSAARAPAKPGPFDSTVKYLKSRKR